MKQKKEIAMRMAPVIVVMIVIMLLSVFLCQQMIDRESEDCWAELKMATVDVAKEMNIRFNDSMTVLDLTADAIVLKANRNQEDQILEYLTNVQERTIFDRIDIVFPDGTILLQNGTYITDEGRTPYSQLVEKGKHISTRTIDPLTNKEAIYYFTPIVTEGETVGMMLGTIHCSTLGNIFFSEHYSGNAQVFLVDLRNGDFLLDNWHDEMGNIYDMGSRQVTDSYENENFLERMMAGETGQVSFYSKINGKISYMSYMKVDGYDCSVSLFVQEDVVFKDVAVLTKLLLFAGFIELLILLAYLVWNIYLVSGSVRNQEKARLAELEKEKNEAKTRFLSSVSHDIKTPLNGIIGMLDVIRLRGDIPEHMEDSLHKIDVSAKYLLTLASDVLDMNEIETGKVVFSNDPLDLKELVNDIGIIMQPKASVRGIRYLTDTDGIQNRYVLGSGVHINKILVNIIDNAIKYNKENGEVSIYIENDVPENNKAIYRFIVKDTGIGMTADFQKKMFNAFEQEIAGARTEQLGHGLGLSIVARLIEQMGGTIEVSSQKDIGSTFVVTLPLLIDTEKKEDTGEETICCDLAGVKILLVEDNALNMEIANVLLSSVGAVITTAENGKVAVELFQKAGLYEYDLILMDIMMPEMDGHKATRMIRAMDRPDAKVIPIIAMTASTFSEDIRRCKEAGMDEHIGKPLDMNTLIVKVAKHYEKFRSTRQ